MDRVNRRFLVASTFIAIPAALLMASLSIGTNPEVPFSSSHESASGSGVQTAFGHSDGSEADKIRQWLASNWAPRLVDRCPAEADPLRVQTGLVHRRVNQQGFSRRSLVIAVVSLATIARLTNSNTPPGANSTAKGGSRLGWHSLPRCQRKDGWTHWCRTAGKADPICHQNSCHSGRWRFKKADGKGTYDRTEAQLRILLFQSHLLKKKSAPQLRTFSSSESSRRSKPVAVATPSSTKSNVASLYGDNRDSDSNYRNEEVADLVPRVRRRVIKADRLLRKQLPKLKQKKRQA